MKRNILTRVDEEIYQRILADSNKEDRSISNFVRNILVENYNARK